MTFLPSSLVKGSVGRRLVSGAGANFLGKVWVLLVQLLFVPVMTAKWGVEGFGVWLMITTIPTYLALSDFGFAMAGGVELTSSVAKGDQDSALKALQTTWVFITSISAIFVAVVFLAAVLWLNLSGSTFAEPFTKSEVFWAICLVTGAAALSLQMTVQKIVFQATHKYALGTILMDLSNFIVSMCVLFSVILGHGIVVAAAVQFVGRLVCALAYMKTRHFYEPWATVGTKHFDKATLKRLFRPSLGALTLTLANSFALQGVVLTIGWALGPGYAAIFATCRMLTRIPLQFSGLLVRASLPELTRSQSQNDPKLTKQLTYWNLRFGLGVLIPSFVLLGILGPTLIDYMSHGEMNAGHLDFLMLGLAAALSGSWTIVGTRLIALNRQGEFAHIALMLYLIVALVPFVSSEDLLLVYLAMILSDAILLYVVNLKDRQ
ncbi:lipopolysaccharide biosynthesis protein [Marinibacterium profundimaris]|uniref:Polysaccharide biosynthesis protein n=1 Tax=Marinibacterium profundimaris TaxID=1679460 RepID=A0A225NEY5_9RHOB|nr:lipopolysaccharide biosynthesis protein [Marinibacterium profundimaris]OWU71513.1 hypothetical protein ATO3_18900 [Marinibacterium profundimaris]